MCVGFPVMLQPGHNGNDHGAALGVFEQVAADSGLDRAAELTVIPAALAAALLSAYSYQRLYSKLR